MLVGVLLDVAAFIDAHDRADRLADAGDHRGELEVAVRHVHRDDAVRLELAEIELQRLARQQMDRDRGADERIDEQQVVGAVRRVGERQPRVADDDLASSARIPKYS